MLKTVASITNAIGALNYKGTWNATTNTPTITSSVGVKGDYYQVSVAGSTTINGISNWGVGDVIAFNGTTWQRIEGGADLNGVNLSVSGTTTLSGLTASTALALNAGKDVVSVTNTGTGNNVLADGPTLTTPTLGAATATSVNKVAITAPATGSTLTIADGKTLTANNSIALTGTDATTMTFPTTNATIARTDAGQTFTGVQVMTSPQVITSINDTNGNELFGVTATASAVNELTVANAATGNNPVISATGSDTNIGITLTPKGTGNTVLTSGNLVVANGNGIDFSATASGSGTMTSELLSDYEEGTFTPAFTPAAGAFTTVNYITQRGKYTKIGRAVHIVIYLLTSGITVGTASGAVKISGLPFTCDNDSYYAIPFAGDVRLFAGDTPDSAQVDINSTNVSLWYRTAANGATIALDVTDLSTGAANNLVIISGTYFV
jgi:hypothetical protein